MSIEIGTSRRAARARTILCATLCLLAAAAGPATAQIRGDFNGDGIGDLAIGAPDEGVVVRRFIGGAFQQVTIAAAGSVTVIFGTAQTGVQVTTASPVPQLIHQEVDGVEDSVETNDRFGAALAVGFFNDDSFADLVVAVPGDNAFQFFEGSQTGLDLAGDRMIFGTQFVDNQGLALRLKPGFAVGDFNGDGLDDLAIEATEPEGIGERVNAIVMPGSAQFGPQFVGLRIFAFNNGTIAAELPGLVREMSLAAGDFNGDGADDLAVGLPDADVLSETGATVFDGGTVTIMLGVVGTIQAGGITVQGATGLTELDANSIPQFNERFGSVLAAGDFDGDGADDLAIGTPREDVVGTGGTFVQDGGFVAVFSRATTLHGVLTQLPLGLNPQAFDNFGGALATGDFNSDGAADLAIGTPGDVVLSQAGAGSVTVLYGILNLGLPRPAQAGLPQINGRGQTFTQATTDVSDTPESGDRFGQSLSASNVGRTAHADLIIGVPDEDLLVSLGGDLNGIQTETRANVGAAHVLYGSNALLQGAGSHFVTQNSSRVPDSAEVGDRFASALP